MIRRLRRSTLIAIEALAAVLALALIAVGALGWRLSQGPLPLPLIQSHVEAELSEARSGRPVTIGSVQLSWSTEARALQLEALDVKIRDRAGGVLTSSRKVTIGLSPLRLLIGQVSVKQAEFLGGDLSFTRQADGSWAFALGPPGAEPDFVVPPPPPNETLNQRVIRALDALAETLRPVGPGGNLQLLAVRDARLVIADAQENAVWRADAATFELARDRATLALRTAARLEGPRGPAPAELRVTTDTAFNAALIEFTARDARPAALLSPAALGPFAGLDAPMTAALTIGLDRGVGVTRLEGDVALGRGAAELPGGRFAISGGRARGRYDLEGDELVIDELALAGARTRIGGAIRVANASALLRASAAQPAAFDVSLPSLNLDVPGVFSDPMALRAVRVTGQIDLGAQEIAVSRIESRIDDAQMRGEGRFYWRAVAGRTAPGLDFNGRIDGAVDARRIIAFWPLTGAEGARDYIGRALQGGRVSNVVAAIAIAPEHVAAGVLPNAALNVSYRYAGAQFRFIDTMSPLTEGAGSAVLRGNDFNLTLDSGRLEGLAVTQGRISVPRLNPRGAMLTIAMRADGDARDIVRVLTQRPLALGERMPFEPDSVGGRGSVTLMVQRPTLPNMQFEDYRFTVDGRFEDVSGVARDNRLQIAEGRLRVSGDQRAIVIAGPLRLGGSAVTMNWTERLGRTVRAPSSYQISGDFAAADLERLGYPVRRIAEGRIGVTVSGAGRGFDPDQATIALDFRNAEVTLPRGIWSKRAGQLASLRFTAERGDNGSLVLSDVDARGPGLSGGGVVRLTRSGDLIEAALPRVVIDGRADARVNVARSEQNAYDVRIAGAFFDAEPFMDGEPQTPAPAAGGGAARATPAAQPLTMTANVQVARLGLRGDATLSDARADVHMERGALVALSAAGRTPRGGAMMLSLGPTASDAQSRVRMRSDDAGFAALALTGADNIVGGAATADGTWAPANGGRADFQLSMRDFKVVRVPAMATLLSTVASLRGLVDALNGDGITFVSMDAPVVIAGDRVTIGEARMAGPAIGLTATGSYEMKRDALDIDGVVVPSYGLNSMLGAVPVLGDLFVSRQGEGMFGMTYSVNGPIANARVGVNPVSALAPGIFRRIFEPIAPRRDAPAAAAQPGG
ncbi:MAG: AsmA-like C-terminal region-containing protein [Hyphomonadaceae bacterium]|nr:AsmA-like C-terminal region-containing protein [Hyphomonadaceae bacterium]